MLKILVIKFLKANMETINSYSQVWPHLKEVFQWSRMQLSISTYPRHWASSIRFVQQIFTFRNACHNRFMRSQNALTDCKVPNFRWVFYGQIATNKPTFGGSH